MRVFTIIISVITLLLLCSMLLCGLWSKSKGLSEKSAKKFHMQLGIITILFSMVTIIVQLLSI